MAGRHGTHGPDRCCLRCRLVTLAEAVVSPPARFRIDNEHDYRTRTFRYASGAATNVRGWRRR